MKKLRTYLGFLLALLVIFLIIPVDLIGFHTNEISTNKIAYDRSLPSIANGNTVSQQFVPQYNHINQLKICVREINCDISQGYLKVIILDSGLNNIYEENYALTNLTRTGWHTVFSDIELIANNTYYLNIEAVDVPDAGPALSFFGGLNATSIEEEGQVLTHAGVPMENCVLKVSFEYAPLLNRIDYLA